MGKKKFKLIEATKLRLEDNEVLVVKIPPYADAESVINLEKWLEHLFGRGRVLLASQDVEFNIIKKNYEQE